MVFFIDRGNYGGVSLDGLAIGTMGQNPPDTTMMGSMGAWDFADILIDERANPAQRQALESLARETFPPVAPADCTQVRVVPIGRRIEGGEHSVSLGPLGSFSAHLLPGGMGGVPKIVDPPGADPFHREYAQGVTTKQTYTGSDQKWDWSDSNYMFGTFEVTSDEFDKFAVAMTQQMQKMNSEKKPQ